MWSAELAARRDGQWVQACFVHCRQVDSTVRTVRRGRRERAELYRGRGQRRCSGIQPEGPGLGALLGPGACLADGGTLELSRRAMHAAVAIHRSG